MGKMHVNINEVKKNLRRTNCEMSKKLRRMRGSSTSSRKREKYQIYKKKKILKKYTCRRLRQEAKRKENQGGNFRFRGYGAS